MVYPNDLQSALVKLLSQLFFLDGVRMPDFKRLFSLFILHGYDVLILFFGHHSEFNTVIMGVRKGGRARMAVSPEFFYILSKLIKNL